MDQAWTTTAVVKAEKGAQACKRWLGGGGERVRVPDKPAIESRAALQRGRPKIVFRRTQLSRVRDASVSMWACINSSISTCIACAKMEVVPT